METMAINEIAASDAFEKITKGESVLIDVRTAAEFSALHAKDAINIPLNLLTPDRLKKTIGERQPIFICQSGSRGRKACEASVDLEKDVLNVTGGTAAWSAVGLPTIRGTGAISLERQVRIAAGSLVVLGIILSLFISQWFLALSAFVGCGLVFSGITDTCGMAMMLAMMPWNKGCGTSNIARSL